MANTENTSPKDGDATEPSTDRLIAQNLRKIYDTVAAEPVPDRFAKLLDELKKQEHK